MESKTQNMENAYFLYFYNDRNLGDDLFLEMLVQRFPDLQFYLYVDDGKPPMNITFRQYSNLHFAKANLSNKTIKTEIQNYAGIILLGGSVFQDLSYALYRGNIGRYLTFKKIIKSGRKVFVLGSNLGPFNTLFGKLMVRLTLRHVTHICVRDRCSFNLLEEWEVPNRECAPDMIFGYNYKPKIGLNRKQNILGISIINTNLNPEARHVYIQKMADLVNAYLESSQENQVRLFGFDGGHENDGQVIDEVVQLVTIKERVVKVEYSDDIHISEYLDLFYECSFIMACRFHSMILAAKFSIPFFPIIYSKKTSYALDDLGYFYDQIKYEKINELDIPKLLRGIQSDTRSFSISSSVVKDCEMHFNGLNHEIY